MKDEKNISPFYASFLSLCKTKGVSPSVAAKESGISSGAPTAWKKNGAVPKAAQRKKLCDYFGVDDATLLGYADIKKEPATSGDELSEEEKLFLMWYRTQATEKDKAIVRAIIESE